MDFVTVAISRYRYAARLLALGGGLFFFFLQHMPLLVAWRCQIQHRSFVLTMNSLKDAIILAAKLEIRPTKRDQI